MANGKILKSTVLGTALIAAMRHAHRALEVTEESIRPVKRRISRLGGGLEYRGRIDN